jgi:uncharacterized phage protein (TIGR01671 family)
VREKAGGEMKEIEFRGIRKNKGERMCLSKWVYGYYFTSWEDGYILWGTTNGIPNMIEVIPETVGQYIGLKDKNGKKVYEGDILRHMDSLSYTDIYIVWDEYTASFGWLSVEWVRTQGKVRKIESLGLDYYEVVGNIHTEVGK